LPISSANIITGKHSGAAENKTSSWVALEMTKIKNY
jgi:hypothetical protein